VFFFHGTSYLDALLTTRVFVDKLAALFDCSALAIGAQQMKPHNALLHPITARTPHAYLHVEMHPCIFFGNVDVAFESKHADVASP
jgi:hypothetical protein